MTVVPLSKLTKGNVAYIDSIVANQEFGEQDALVARRLADLGFSKGVPVEVVAAGVWGKGPFAVKLSNHSQFSLRAAEASKILCHIK